MKEPLSFVSNSIRTLNLAKCGFFSAGAEELFSYLQSHHIQKLIISGNSISEKVALGRLFDMLWRNKNLEHFEMDDCQIGELGGVNIG